MTNMFQKTEEQKESYFFGVISCFFGTEKTLKNLYIA